MPGPFYEIDGLRPVVDAGAFVHPAAVVIGDVFIAEGVYVGPHASLRGDFGRISLAGGSNVQDGCVMHAFPDDGVEVGEEGHVGHGAILHGCRIAEGAMVGIGAVVLDGAVVGAGAIVGANATVTAGASIPAGHLALGTPARVVRELAAKELEWKRQGTLAYQRLVTRSLASLEPCAPLRQAEEGRRSVGEIHPAERMVAPKAGRG